MSDLLAKLRRLRREAPRDGPAASRAPASAASTAGLAAEGKTVGEPRDLVTETVGGEAYAVRSLCFGPEHVHGEWSLTEVDASVLADVAALSRDASLASLDLRRAVYLDIETTGLSGGAGTIPFLVALGRFTEGGRFELWQGFLRGPEEEPAMLRAVAERVAEADGVVSFFGKSFDRHRLEDKMRMYGIDAPFAERPHLDLYHPLQRLYRAAFADGRLATMERGLCGVERIDDLPGRYAPEAWFDFLGERAHRLEAVFRHNADDVLSLVVLAAHLGRVLVETRADGRPLGGPAAERAAALGRLFATERRRAEALTWIDRALDRTDADAEPRALRVLQAHLWRASGDGERALAAYEELAVVPDRDAVDCLVGAAIVAEHALGDARRALDATRRAQRLVARTVTGAARQRLEVELAHRERRLEGRLARAQSART